ncbi:MAG: hypothetical protein AMXMBFR83_02160 [Phycisphaerae bacterium]
MTSIVPNTGINTGSQAVNVFGAAFQAGATVKLVTPENVPALPDIVGTDVQVVASSQIACSFDLTDAVLGYRNVVVTNPGGQSASLLHGFQVIGLRVYYVTPARGPNTGGLNVSVHGEFFDPAATVKLRRWGQPDVNGTNVVVSGSGSATIINCTFDLTGRTPGRYHLIVTNPDHRSATYPQGFEIIGYGGPGGPGVYPNAGPNVGRLTLSLYRSAIPAGATLKLRKAARPDIDGSNTAILHSTKVSAEFDLDGADPGFWDLVVVHPDGASTVLPSAFRVIDSATARVIFVSPAGDDDDDGLSWATAKRTIHAGLSAAAAGDQVWVAAGVYKPDRDADHPDGSGDREATFQLIEGVALRGGFAGNEDPATFHLDDRDFEAHATILSGDLAGDDGPDFANYADNCYHVLTGTGTGATTIVDGFTVTGGNPDGAILDGLAGGLDSTNGNPTVTNCLFRVNNCGMRSDFGNSMVVNCTFDRNSPLRYGTAGVNGMSLTLINCGFHSATSGWQASNCGATGEDVIAIGCSFTDNRHEYVGGALVAYRNATVIDTDFARNWASDGAGIFGGTSTTIINCDFEENTAYEFGTVLSTGILTATGCRFHKNSAAFGGGIYGKGNVMLTDCTFSENPFSWSGGGVFMATGNLTMTRCTFAANRANEVGGAVYMGDGTLNQCVFTGNSSDQGGALFISGSPKLVNCTFNGNKATDGGGVYVSSGIPVLINCTFTGNLVYDLEYGGAAVSNRSTDGPVNLTNCILWGNSPTQISGLAVVSHSCVQGGAAGVGNIDADPLFVGPGNLRLRAGSPCLDAGDNAILNGSVGLDLAGLARFRNDPVTPDCRWAPGTCGPAPVVDLGAYEYIPGDFDRDGDIDGADVGAFNACASASGVAYAGDCAAADFDNDGDIDQADYGALQGCISGDGRPVDPACTQ